MCVQWAEKNSRKLGGKGKVVEIDEAKFGKRKHNRGHIDKEKWVFGDLERDSKKVFVEAVVDRKS